MFFATHGCRVFYRRATGAYCAWCSGHISAHPFIDTTPWAAAGPFLGPGRSETWVDNPAFEVSA